MSENRKKKSGSSAGPILFFVLLLVASVVSADPRRWPDVLGLPVRQGHHIEWQRASYRATDGHVLLAWSDTRTGDRDVYAQLLNPDGSIAWTSTGIPVGRYPQYRQEDVDVVKVNGGWFLAWFDFRNDSLGDVWAMKIDENGNLMCPAGGIEVDGNPSYVNELSLRIAHDGAGGAIIAWEDQRRGDPGDILAQHVDANCNVTWAQPLAVTDTAGEQIGITAESDGLGNMILAWNDKRDPSNQNIYAAKITPQGTLPWGGVNGRVICNAAGSQDQVKICPGGDGGAYYTWRDQRGGASRDTYAQRFNASGQAQWQENGVLVCDAAEDQNQARIVASFNSGNQDGVLLVWEDLRVNGFVNEVRAQKLSTTGQLQWPGGTNGVFICGNAGPGGTGQTREGGRLTSDQAGGAVIAWEDARADGNWLKCDIYACRLNAAGNFVWGNDCGIPVAVAENQQFAPLLRADEGNGVFIIWDDTRLGSQAIKYQLFDINSGTAQLGADQEVVFGLDGDAEKPRSIPMSMGRVGMVWQDNRFIGGGTRLYFQIADTLGHFEKSLNGDPLVGDNQNLPPNQTNHALCSDGSSGFFCAFEDLRTGVKRIRVVRINSLGQRVGSDAGTMVWDRPELQDQGPVYCAADGQGGAYIVWSGYDQSFLQDVYVMRVNNNCEPIWTQPVRLTTANDDDLVRRALSNPDGCCIATWQSGPLGQFNVSAARICQDGSVTWNLNVCNAEGDQKDAVAVADGQGGAYFSWSDERDQVTLSDIYAQHLNSAGQPSWTANGIVVSNALQTQKTSNIDMDNDHNIYVSWEDFRSADNLDLYAQKISPAGQRLWPVSGKPIAAPVRLDQTECQIETEWGNGVYFVWTDARGAYTDLYATHFDQNGNVADPYFRPDSGGVICDFYQVQRNATVADDGHGALIATWEDGRASGKEPLINIWAQWVNDLTVGVDEVRGVPLPATAELSQNFPNPFNPSTAIRISVPTNELVQLEVFNTLGQKVATLVNKVLTAGTYDVTFDASRLGSGVYLYRMKTQNFESVKKMTVLK